MAACFASVGGHSRVTDAPLSCAQIAGWVETVYTTAFEVRYWVVLAGFVLAFVLHAVLALWISVYRSATEDDLEVGRDKSPRTPAPRTHTPVSSLLPRLAA